MATVKSSAENLTLNADGSGNDIVFQSNGSNVGTLTAEGVLTATSFAGSGASLTGITSVGGATGADFNDNVKLRFGTGNDLEIYHNGSYSIIKDGGTGALALLTSDFQVLNPADSEYMIRGVEDGDVKLYHNGIWKLQTSAAGINLAGGLDITDGDIVFSTAGKGICLGVTSNTDANTLDDYEEGTWTPTAQSGLASLSATGTCAYTKIGNICYINAGIGFSGSGTGSGDIEIGGLPFASVNNSAMRGSISIFLEGAASNWAQGVSGFVQSNASYIRLRENGSTSSGSSQGNKIDAGTGLMIIAHYRVA